jgi:hypothetical protein
VVVCSPNPVAQTKHLTHPRSSCSSRQILKKGELQVGEKERSHNLTNISRDIATQVAEKCVDPSTQRPYSVTMIEKAMAEIGYSVKPDKNAKSQVETYSFLSLSTESQSSPFVSFIN